MSFFLILKCNFKRDCFDIKHLPYAIMPIRGGLFGDKLFLYAKAKWFSYQYKIPFIYKPYKYFDELVLHAFEKLRIDSFNENYFKKKITIPYQEHELNFPQVGTLYYVWLKSYDSEWSKYNDKIKKEEIIIKNIDTKNITKIDKIDLVKTPSCIQQKYCIIPEEFYFNHFFHATRDNSLFFLDLKKLITPSRILNFVPLPKNKITVGVHVRKGGKFEFFCKRHPKEISTRILKNNYYIEMLRFLSEILHDKPMYIFLFTNHQEPLLLIEKFEKNLMKKNMEFVCRDVGSNTSNVLEDLFSMSKCDCLIRPNSSFSQMAQLIGNHKVIIYPREAVWETGKLSVNKIGLISNAYIFDV